MTELLVTGANGFLGTAVVRVAIEARLSVRATDRRHTSSWPGVGYCQANILDPQSLKPAFEGVDSVIHAAGLAHIFRGSDLRHAPFKEVNGVGTENVALAAAQSGVSNLVLISSVSVYGRTAGDASEDSPCHPEGPYAESKWLGERRAIDIARNSGMRLTILRLATLYGEGDPGNVARLITMIDRRRFIWIGKGANRKSLLYRDDAARACLTALNRSDGALRIYNVAASPCTMRQVVEGIAEALGTRLPGWHIPEAMAKPLARTVAAAPGRLRGLSGTLEKWLADDAYAGTRFEQAYAFSPRVDLQEGLRREVAWYRSTKA